MEEAGKETERSEAREDLAEARQQSDRSAQNVQAVDETLSLVRKPADDGTVKVPLWLITFTDVMALMLTFFVLLYSMSTPEAEKWDDISDALSNKLNVFDASAFHAGSQDSIAIDKIKKTKALEIPYVKSLIKSLLTQRDIQDVVLIDNDKRLVISLPSELLFQSGQADISIEGKKLIFELGGVLSRLKNRIEVIGHTDPDPVRSSDALYANNWELSLARASSVAMILRNVGYERDIIVRGLSSSRYDEMPTNISKKERYVYARRVDVIITDDSGHRMNAFDVAR